MRKKKSNIVEISNVESSTVFNDISVMWISRFDYLEGEYLPPHTHFDYYQMIYFLSGQCTVTINQELCHIDRPCILFVPAGIDHAISNISGTGIKTLDIKFRINSAKLRDKCVDINYLNFDFDQVWFKNTFETILEEGVGKDYEYQSYCQLLLGEILLKLTRCSKGINFIPVDKSQCFEPEHASMLVVKLIAYVENNYKKDLNCSDFEDAMHFSYRYLSRITSKELGLSPYAMVEQYRIFLSRDMLAYTDNEIKLIASELGYPDVHQFSRSFKRIVGMPPGQYRKQKRDGICQGVNIGDGFSNKILTKKTAG